MKKSFAFLRYHKTQLQRTVEKGLWCASFWIAGRQIVCACWFSLLAEQPVGDFVQVWYLLCCAAVENVCMGERGTGKSVGRNNAARMRIRKLGRVCSHGWRRWTSRVRWALLFVCLRGAPRISIISTAPLFPLLFSSRWFQLFFQFSDNSHLGGKINRPNEVCGTGAFPSMPRDSMWLKKGEAKRNHFLSKLQAVAIVRVSVSVSQT